MLRKVDKTIVLPIYYSLYHDENVIVNTLLYAQLLYEIISLENIIMFKKRTCTYTYPVCWFFIADRALGANSSSVYPNTRRDKWTKNL